MIQLYRQAIETTERHATALLPLLARLIFAAVLAPYFWASALTKLGDGILLSFNAYAQIFPRAFEAAGYDVSQMALWQTAVVATGTLAEFALPALIIAGLATRLAALGMVGFVLLQSATDIIGHHADASALGRWFDRIPDAPILDQRALWVVLFAVLIARGAGTLSLDRLIAKVSAGRA